MTELTEFAGRDGNRLVADVAGDPADPPVVLLHGGGQTRHSWGTTLTMLGDKGWRAYSVDLRGHGDSEWAADGDYTLDAFAGDVVAITRALGDAPALVGASLGGIASLAAIGEQPDEEIARALVLVDVAPRIEEAGRDRIGAFMIEHMDDGFASLDEVADAIQGYNPHRPRPTNLDGLEKNLRQGDDGRWYWHWDPAFIGGRLGGTDETRASLVDPKRLQEAARRDPRPDAARARTGQRPPERRGRAGAPRARAPRTPGRRRRRGSHGRRRPQRPLQRRGRHLPRRRPTRPLNVSPPRSDPSEGAVADSRNAAARIRARQHPVGVSG